MYADFTAKFDCVMALIKPKPSQLTILSNLLRTTDSVCTYCIIVSTARPSMYCIYRRVISHYEMHIANFKHVFPSIF